MDANRGPAESTVPIDPVCGRTIEPAPTAYHGHHGGRAYYFCSMQCRDAFQANPGAFPPPHEPVMAGKLREARHRLA